MLPLLRVASTLVLQPPLPLLNFTRPRQMVLPEKVNLLMKYQQRARQ
jgi:hypothetical protein